MKIQGIGWVRLRMHRAPIGSRIASATYVEEPDGKVFLTVVLERHKRVPTKPRVLDPAFDTAATFDGLRLA